MQLRYVWVMGFSVDDMKKTRLYRYVYGFLVDYDNTSVADILDIKNNLQLRIISNNVVAY